MTGLNRVQLIGYIGQEVTMNKTKDNRCFASASLATHESFKRNDQWETITQWHNLVFFDKLASRASRLQKGGLVFIEGKLRLNHWIDKNGVKRQSMSIMVQSMQLIEPIKAKETLEQNPKTAEVYLEEMHALLNNAEASF